MATVSSPTEAGTIEIDETLGDLREFLRKAELAGCVEHIRGASADNEIGGLFDLSNKHPYPPVLVFEDIPGYDRRFRIISNVRTSKLIVGEISLEAVKAYRRQPKTRSEPIEPRVIKDGPVLENVLDGSRVDVTQFPAPQWHPGDGGRYIGTECMIIMRDPDTGWVNLGTYRTMIHDATTLGIFVDTGKHADFIRQKYWSRGEACPVAVCVGQSPVLSRVASASVAEGVSEYAVAGGLIGRPIDVVLGKETGLPIPADAELVFEGYMPPLDRDSRIEGPFGEWPGYYASHARKDAVVHVKTVYHRDDLMITGQPPLSPIYPGQQFKIAQIAALWDALEGAGVAGVTGVWKMLGAGHRFIDVIRINQLFPGHAKMAGLVTAGCRDGAYMTRLIIIVDDDINIEDPAEVMWAVSTRWDPKTQTDIIDGCWSSNIDPVLSPEKRESGDITTSRMIMYAVRPYHWKENYPKPYGFTPGYAAELRAKWQGQLKFLSQ